MILVLRIIGFFLLLFGLFKLLNIAFFPFVKELSEQAGKIELKFDKSLKAMKEEVTKKTEVKKGLVGLIYRVREMLLLSGRQAYFSLAILTSLIFGVAGAIIGSTFSLFAVPILIATGVMIPWIYLLILNLRWQKELNDELEVTLSVITTSYLRTNHFLSSVEENIEYINPPLKAIFEAFLVEATLVSTDTKRSLLKLKNKVSNDVFKEWIDAVILCLDNKEMNVLLTPIVSKLSDSKVVSMEMSTILYEPLKEYIVMIILFLINLPLLRVLNKNWYHHLFYTKIGKLTLTISLLYLIFSIPLVIHLTRPVSYKD